MKLDPVNYLIAVVCGVMTFVILLTLAAFVGK